MKPPTLAMIRLLREIERQPVTMSSADKRTLTALAARCLVGIPAGERMPYSRARWQLTDEGRRVLAEHTTTGESR